VAFEPVFIAHLSLAYLAVPAQTLKPFRLHFVGEVLGGADFGARHRGGSEGRKRGVRGRCFLVGLAMAGVVVIVVMVQ
jgi:hypothetical protein